MNLELKRDVLEPDYTLGELFLDGKHFGYTCEDCDRQLEIYGEPAKVQDQTAIPRGRYKVEVSFSNRFQKELPIFLSVPYFTGIRIHGGNTAANSSGCVLLGRVRELEGVSNCAERVATLTKLLDEAEERGEQAWISVL